MRTYKCINPIITYEFGNPRLKVRMLENHNELGGAKGEVTITSVIKLIDFERRFAITQNNIYDWS